MGGCVAYGCTNVSKKGCNISFHSFPKDKSIFKQWIHAIRRDDFKPSRFSKLCAEHFEETCFIYNFGLKKLAQNAVPTKFNFPSHISKQTTIESSTTLKVQSDPRSDTSSDLHKDLLVTAKMENRIDPKSSTSSFSLDHHCIPNSNNNNDKSILSSQEIILPQATAITRRRKRSVPAHMGDICDEDFNNPEKMKYFWSIAKKRIEKQRKSIKYLQSRNNRLARKQQSLQQLLIHLKHHSKISSS